MTASQIVGDEIGCPKNNGFALKYDITKESNGAAIMTEREFCESTEEKRKSSERFSGQQVKWFSVFVITIYHAMVIYCYITYPYIQRFKTVFFAWITVACSSFGVTAGAHRLWTHRSYKAKTPFRILLLCCYYTTGLNPLYNWVRDHRIHHKYSETDADPHNSKRGFFFSHVGWLMLRRHPEVIKKGRQIDMSDITSDPVVAFGEKYFLQLKIFFCFVLPVIIPVYFWNEDWYYAIVAQWFLRYGYSLNAIWSVNSVAHMFGWRPFDKTIAPTENGLVSYMTGGEGWHNYHHTFPWDYKTSEFKHIFLIDVCTNVIQMAAAIGWAYDLKEPSEELIRKTIERKGDGSHIEVPPPTEETKASL